MDNRYVLILATDAYIAQLEYRIWNLGNKVVCQEELTTTAMNIKNTTEILAQVKAFRKAI